MKRIILSVFTIVWLALQPDAAKAQKPAPLPNIIFILTDDLGYGDIGVFYQHKRRRSGLPYELTPNLDRMAAQGALLTQQYCNAPVCAPSRASFLSGVHQGNAIIRDSQFDKALENGPTIASVLKQAGYTTCAIGKWGLQGDTHQEPEWPAHPLKRGFDNYLGYIRHRDGHEHYPFEGIYRGKKQVWMNYQNIADDLQKCYTTDLFTAYTKKWITEQQKKSQPFFVFLSYDVPHAVLELPTGKYPEGGGLQGGVQWLGTPGQMITTASGTIDSYVYPEYDTATYDHDQNPATHRIPWPDTYKRHASCCRRVDDAVGDIFQLLKDLKIDENTLVVFTSDNGPSNEDYLPREKYIQNQPHFFESYGPFDGIKRDCWEGGVRVPAIAHWPAKINAGKIITTPAMHSDWMATFAEIARVPIPARVGSTSLLPSLTGKGIQETPQVYIEYLGEQGSTPGYAQFDPAHRNRKRGQMQMLRQANYVGIRYNVKSASDDFEIYQILQDPKQTNNLATQPAFAPLQQQFKNKARQLHSINPSAPRPYDSATIPSVAVPQSLIQGLNWKLYPGKFLWPTKEKGLTTPTQKGKAKTLTGKEATTAGMLVYEGYVKIETAGSYQFFTQVSAPALVKLHEINLFDAYDETHQNKELTTTVALQAGYHPIKIYLVKPPETPLQFNFSWKKSEAVYAEPVQNLLSVQ